MTRETRFAAGFALTALLVFSAVRLSAYAAPGTVPEQINAPREAKRDIKLDEGYYTCTGKDKDGDEYECLVSLVQKDDTYVMEWHAAGGIMGVGMLEDNRLAVAFRSRNGQVIGVATYKPEWNGDTKRYDWVGRQAVLGPGLGKPTTEKLEFLKAFKKKE